MTGMIVVRPGLLSTVQDLGRWGHQAAGVPVCGAMDTWSHRLANRLVGNTTELATIEITVGDFEARFTHARIVALTGAEMDAVIGDQPFSAPAVFTVWDGARLVTARARRGVRAYLAVRGGFAVPAVLGSRSTFIRGGFGGVDGRALRAGDEVPIGSPANDAQQAEPASRDRLVACDWLPRRGEVTTLRVLASDVPGHAPLVARLMSCDWTVTPASDRMGYRLDGAPGAVRVTDVLTMPTAMGSVQLPPSSQPILLMADRQTTGGYAQPAAVITADLPVAAQLAPGDRVRFATADLVVARDALVAREAQLAAASRAPRS